MMTFLKTERNILTTSLEMESYANMSALVSLLMDVMCLDMYNLPRKFCT